MKRVCNLCLLLAPLPADFECTISACPRTFVEPDAELKRRMRSEGGPVRKRTPSERARAAALARRRRARKAAG